MVHPWFTLDHCVLISAKKWEPVDNKMLQNLNRLSALDLSRNRLRRVPGPNWFASDESLWENLSMLRRVDLSHSEFY